MIKSGIRRMAHGARGKKPKIMDLIEFKMNTHGTMNPFESCCMCPRACRVNRCVEGGEAKLGVCGETHHLRVAHVGAHFGEEPPITGEKGSGTVFFTGCSLRCSFCQNFQISQGGVGSVLTPEALAERIEAMIRVQTVHNVNFVTPDHFFPHVFRVVDLLRHNGHTLPVVYNLSGYQSADLLRQAEDFVDIYLPDFKYADPRLAAKLSRCLDYPSVALEAIALMARQKGFLDACGLEGDPAVAAKGLLVRHLILPGFVENSKEALTTLFIEFGPGLPVSLMSQYHPVVRHRVDSLNRLLSEAEFEAVYHHAQELGFEHLFVQFPKKAARPEGTSPFVPDFERTEPFEGNQKALRNG
jgi:putative pyruvate formate lyase activating enzyme